MRKLTKILLAGAIALGSASTFAATQGVLQAIDSTGDIDITLGKGETIQISNLSDVALGDFSVATAGNTIPSGNTTACVFSTGATYLVTATSGNSGNAGASGTSGLPTFRLNNGGAAAADHIRYTVAWNDLDAAAPNTGLANATQNAQAFVPDNVNTDCGTPATGFNVDIALNPNDADFDSANVGNYTDTLTFTVAAQ